MRTTEYECTRSQRDSYAWRLVVRLTESGRGFTGPGGTFQVWNVNDRVHCPPPSDQPPWPLASTTPITSSAGRVDSWAASARFRAAAAAKTSSSAARSLDMAFVT